MLRGTLNLDRLHKMWPSKWVLGISNYRWEYVSSFNSPPLIYVWFWFHQLGSFWATWEEVGGNGSEYRWPSIFTKCNISEGVAGWLLLYTLIFDDNSHLHVTAEKVNSSAVLGFKVISMLMIPSTISLFHMILQTLKYYLANSVQPLCSSIWGKASWNWIQTRQKYSTDLKVSV